VSTLRRLLPLLLALCAAAPACAVETAPPLGRLFLTPEARASLERQRQLNLREARSIEGGSLRLDGIVVRSSGKTTVWVNNQPQTENALDTGVAVATSPRRPDRATLVTGAEPPAELRVGAALDRATRETSDGLADGVIQVNPPGRK